MGQAMEAFSRDVAPIVVHPCRYTKGLATVVEMDVPDEIRARLDQDHRELACGHWKGMVQLGSGERVRGSFTYPVGGSGGAPPADHPAAGVLSLINSQPLTAIRRLFRTNMPCALEEADRIGSPVARSHVLAELARIGAGHPSVYRHSPLTPRIHARGASPDRLPKQVRRALFKGCVEIDMVAAGLTIAAYRWNLTAIKGMLQQEEPFWEQALRKSHLSETDLPIVKRFVLATLYGARRDTANEMLKDGHGQHEGIGAQGLRSLAGTAWVKELRAGARSALRTIRYKGFVTDAFGRKLSTNDVRNLREAGRRMDRIMLAILLQSIEMKIMRSVVPVIRSENRTRTSIRMVSWQHDGLTLSFVSPSERDRQVKRTRDAIVSAAAEIGISARVRARCL